MKDIQIELVNQMEKVLDNVIKNAIENGHDIANIVYCSNFASEELALKYSRIYRVKNKDIVEQEYMSELCKGCSNICSSCMVWKEHNGIGAD